MTNTSARVSIIVHGRVQGVYYRLFTKTEAKKLGIEGYVRNLPDSTVEVEAEGKRDSLEKFIDSLKKGPGGAQVIKQDIQWSDYTGSYSSFEIRY